MPGKKQTSGLRLYNRLMHELTLINNRLSESKKLSLQQRRDLLTNKIYPKQKNIPAYKFRITQARIDLEKDIRRGSKKISHTTITPGKKQTSGLRLYNRLMHELSQLNNALPESRRLSLRQRRDLLTDKIYPKYKDVPASKFRITEARAELEKKLKHLPKKAACDVTALPESIYAEIDYFNIDSFITDVLPGCLYIKISAGEFGQTNIFNTRDFDYHSSGIADITNSINQYERSFPKRKAIYPYYTGIVSVRPRKPNDGNPDNYYLDMILVINNITAKQLKPATIPKAKTKKRIKKKRQVQQIVQKRVKKIAFKKSKVKRIKQNLIAEINDFKKFLKKKYITDKDKKAYAKRAYEVEKNKLDKNLKQGNITQARYQTLLQQIKKGYGQK